MRFPPFFFKFKSRYFCPIITPLTGRYISRRPASYFLDPCDTYLRYMGMLPYSPCRTSGTGTEVVGNTSPPPPVPTSLTLTF